mmetsp:Transcript_10696/g.18899  ORF Transcript_10696/g.18899 Transcript_10696/m.18899 type:complete len:293 (-) Transcript_10696:77-955(-)
MPRQSDAEKKRLKSVHTLFHLGMSAEEAKVQFKDITTVCMGGTSGRAKELATEISKRINSPIRKLCEDRFVVYKVHDIVTVSHGMGGPSVSIAVNEVILALKLAENKEDVTFYRIGTTGGIGVGFGSVVVTSEALNEDLEPVYHIHHLGKRKSFPAVLDQELSEALAEDERAILGKTVTANCFYENQGRMDGGFCEHTLEDKMNFLQHLHDKGVRNIEMEIIIFSALIHRAGYRAVACCAVLLDRLEGDDPKHPLGANPAVEVVADFLAKSRTRKSNIKRQIEKAKAFFRKN